MLAKNPIFSLLFIFSFFNSCNGQTQIKIESLNKSSKSVAEQPKMMRTQGTDYTQVSCGFMDKKGNLWFGTENEGVYRFDGKSFTQFTKKDGLNDNCVKDIIEDKAGNILFVNGKGISKFDGKKINNFFESDTLINLRITSLLQDREGNFWFGVIDKGIYRYDGKKLSNVLYEYQHPFYGKKQEKYIRDILEDKSGNIWFSSWNGGGVWKYDGKTFINFLPSKNYYQSNEDGRNINIPQNTAENPLKTFYSPSQDHITDDMIFSITEDKAGNIWFGTRRHGACRFDGRTFSSFTANNGFINSNSVLEDKNGNIWFTTEKSGVWRYDRKTYKNFTEKDGLVNNSVWFVLEDKSGNLWFGTEDLV